MTNRPLPLSSTNCTACGAPIRRINEPVIVCNFCGTAYIRPEHQPPPPVIQQQVFQNTDIGDLILGADFNDPDIPGWVKTNTEGTKIQRQGSGLPELWAGFKKEDSYKNLLSTPGPLDEFDASVNIRFIKGDMDGARAGFEFCYGDTGNYLVAISPLGTVCIGYHVKREWGDYLSSWGEHPSLNSGWGAVNRLRVVHRGDQIRVFINGDLATSLRDSRYEFGRVIIAVGPIGKYSEFAFSELQIREAK